MQLRLSEYISMAATLHRTTQEPAHVLIGTLHIMSMYNYINIGNV